MYGRGCPSSYPVNVSPRLELLRLSPIFLHPTLIPITIVFPFSSLMFIIDFVDVGEFSFLFSGAGIELAPGWVRMSNRSSARAYRLRGAGRELIRLGEPTRHFCER